jgi:hypothetical protein
MLFINAQINRKITPEIENTTKMHNPDLIPFVFLFAAFFLHIAFFKF